MKLQKRFICLAAFVALCTSTATYAAVENKSETQNDAVSSATAKPAPAAQSVDVDIDAMTSASIVQKASLQNYKPKGFSNNAETKKALFVVGDPRKDSVNYDLAMTAMQYFEDMGVEVELRDLYDVGFNPVITKETFFNAKDGFGETPKDIKTEQDFVTQADYIIFVYPNWHDSPNAMLKGYIERVFEKQFAYKDTDNGLEGMLTGKSIYTIMNCGFLGGGQGFIGDGVGINNALWDTYMNAFKVLDDDLAGFWGVENKGRFVNDRSPKNHSKTYQEDIDKLRNVLKDKLKRDFFN